MIFIPISFKIIHNNVQLTEKRSYSRYYKMERFKCLFTSFFVLFILFPETTLTFRIAHDPKKPLNNHPKLHHPNSPNIIVTSPYSSSNKNPFYQLPNSLNGNIITTSQIQSLLGEGVSVPADQPVPGVNGNKQESIGKYSGFSHLTFHHLRQNQSPSPDENQKSSKLDFDPNQHADFPDFTTSSDETTLPEETDPSYIMDDPNSYLPRHKNFEYFIPEDSRPPSKTKNGGCSMQREPAFHNSEDWKNFKPSRKREDYDLAVELISRGKTDPSIQALIMFCVYDKNGKLTHYFPR